LDTQNITFEICEACFYSLVNASLVAQLNSIKALKIEVQHHNSKKVILVRAKWLNKSNIHINQPLYNSAMQEMPLQELNVYKFT